MRYIKNLSILFLAAALLAGCSAADTSKTDGCSDEEFGCPADVKKENSFTEISFDDAIDFFKEGKTGVLYFGYSGCPWCQEVVPILEEQKDKHDLDVYWIKTRDAEGERLYTDEQKEEIIPYIQEYMKNNKEGELTLYVPLVLNVQDGQIMAGHQGTVKGHDAHERTMTDEELDEVQSTFEEMFEYQ